MTDDTPLMEHIRVETILSKGQSVQCANEAGPLDGEICRRQAKGVPSCEPILQPTSGPETTPGAAGAPSLHLPLKFKMAHSPLPWIELTFL